VTDAADEDVDGDVVTDDVVAGVASEGAGVVAGAIIGVVAGAITGVVGEGAAAAVAAAAGSADISNFVISPNEAHFGTCPGSPSPVNPAMSTKYGVFDCLQTATPLPKCATLTELNPSLAEAFAMRPRSNVNSSS